MNPKRKDLIQFPTSYPLKVIGHNHAGFMADIQAIISRHVPGLEPEAFRLRPSQGAKYLALTVNFTAESQQQLEALYAELHAHELVIMTL